MLLVWSLRGADLCCVLPVLRGALLMKNLLLALVAVVPVTGCTSLEATHVASEGERVPTVGNFIYALPKTSFIVTGSVTLNGCSAVKAFGKRDYRPSLDLTETFAVTPIVEADEDAQYAIPYDKLRTFLKETQVTLTLNANKTFGGINAAVNDQAGPILLSGLLAAVKVAGGLGVPATPAQQLFHGTLSPELLKLLRRTIKLRRAEPPPPTYCTDEVLNALKQIDADNQKIYAQTGSDANAKATIPNPNIAKWQSEIAQLRRDYGLNRTFNLVWSPALEDGADDGHNDTLLKSLDVYGSLIATWLNPAGRAWYANEAVNGSKPGFHAVHDPIIAQLVVRHWTMGQPLTVDTRKAIDAGDLVLRDPAIAELRLCRNSCSSEGGIEASSDLASPIAVNLPQFGRYVVLPLKNQIFENSSLTVQVNPDGSIASIGNHSTGTLATNLATVGQIGDQLATNAKAGNDAIAAANSVNAANAAAVDIANKTLADCLAQQAAVKAAGGTPIGTCQ